MIRLFKKIPPIIGGRKNERIKKCESCSTLTLCESKRKKEVRIHFVLEYLKNITLTYSVLLFIFFIRLSSEEQDEMKKIFLIFSARNLFLYFVHFLFGFYWNVKCLLRRKKALNSIFLFRSLFCCAHLPPFYKLCYKFTVCTLF